MKQRALSVVTNYETDVMLIQQSTQCITAPVFIAIIPTIGSTDIQIMWSPTTTAAAAAAAAA